MAEWSMATDCKSVGESLRWFKSNFHHHFYADLAQQVEHIHGKDGVSGSSPEVGSRYSKGSGDFFLTPFSLLYSIFTAEKTLYGK